MAVLSHFVMLFTGKKTLLTDRLFTALVKMRIFDQILNSKTMKPIVKNQNLLLGVLFIIIGTIWLLNNAGLLQDITFRIILNGSQSEYKRLKDVLQF